MLPGCMSAWKKPSRNTWVKKIVTPSRASFADVDAGLAQPLDLADRHAVHALHHDHVGVAAVPEHLGDQHQVQACHVAAQLGGVGRLAHQVELVVQVLVELGHHLARLQALAVGRQPLDPARPACAAAPGRSRSPPACRGAAPSPRPRAPSSQRGEVHLRDRCAGHRLARRSCANIVVDRPAEGALDRSPSPRCGGKRRHAVLQQRQLVGDVGAAAGRAGSTAPGRT